jgi:RIO-like serine/threonine protein kinase
MVFGEVKAILDLVDKFNEKKQHDEESNNFDRVLTAIYQLGMNGHQIVSLETLHQHAGLKKLDVLNAIEEATKRGWIIDAGSKQIPNNWGLKTKGIVYLEGLLEQAKSEYRRLDGGKCFG